MNKYQVALDNVRMFEREHNMSKFGDVVPQPNSDILQELVDKETKYQSLEEELGIDLITLFKALKDGIEVGNDKMRLCLKNCKLTYKKEDNEYAFIYDYYLVKLKDYGKNWWLEKPKENEDDCD